MVNIATILRWIIYLCYEYQLWIHSFDMRYCPMPKLHWHHLCHIATESIYPFRCPEQQDLQHLMPCVWMRMEVRCSTATIVHTIVQLHCFIPIIYPWRCRKAVIPRSSSRIFHIVFSIKLRTKRLIHTIIKVVVMPEVPIFSISCAQWLYSFWCRYRIIITCHMVRYKVHNHLKSSLMRTSYQFLPLLHALLWLICQIGIYVVIISHCVWRPSLTFHHCTMICWLSYFAIISLRCMVQNTCVPHVCISKIFQSLQHFRREHTKFPHTILLNRTILRIPLRTMRRLTSLIAKQSWQHLIYN